MARLCSIRSHLTTEAVLSSRQEGTTNANYGKSLDQYPVDTGRLRRVVEVAAERSGWAHKNPGQGRALGFAAHRSFLSYVAAVVDVEVDKQGQGHIPRVDLAVDAGRVIHPERVQAQCEGAAVFATSVALMGEITAATARSSSPITTTTRWRGSPRRPMRRTCTSCRAMTCRPAWASQACPRRYRRSVTRCSLPLANAFASSRSRIPS